MFISYKMKIEFAFSSLCFISCMITCDGSECKSSRRDLSKNFVSPVHYNTGQKTYEDEMCDEKRKQISFRTLFTFDFFDHLKGLTHIKQLNACKCVYNWMQTETTSIETTAPLARWHKKLPFKPRSTDNKCIFLKPTIVKCAINNQPFILIEGYMGRFCLKCIDIYIINIEHNKESFNYTQFIFDDKADIEGTVVGKIEGFDYGAL